MRSYLPSIDSNTGLDSFLHNWIEEVASGELLSRSNARLVFLVQLSSLQIKSDFLDFGGRGSLLWYAGLPSHPECFP